MPCWTTGRKCADCTFKRTSKERAQADLVIIHMQWMRGGMWGGQSLAECTSCGVFGAVCGNGRHPCQRQPLLMILSAGLHSGAGRDVQGSTRLSPVWRPEPCAGAVPAGCRRAYHHLCYLLRVLLLHALSRSDQHQWDFHNADRWVLMFPTAGGRRAAGPAPLLPQPLHARRHRAAAGRRPALYCRWVPLLFATICARSGTRASSRHEPSGHCAASQRRVSAAQNMLRPPLHRPPAGVPAW